MPPHHGEAKIVKEEDVVYAGWVLKKKRKKMQGERCLSEQDVPSRSMNAGNGANGEWAGLTRLKRVCMSGDQSLLYWLAQLFLDMYASNQEGSCGGSTPALVLQVIPSNERLRLSAVECAHESSRWVLRQSMLTSLLASRIGYAKRYLILTRDGALTYSLAPDKPTRDAIEIPHASVTSSKRHGRYCTLRNAYTLLSSNL